MTIPRIARFEPHGPAGTFYTWVALPVFYFLLWRVLWRWALWIGVLVRIAGMRLRTEATHPDGAGGIRINAVSGKEDIGIDNYAGNRGMVSAALDYKVSQRVNLRLDAEYYQKNVSEQAAISVPAAVTCTSSPGLSTGSVRRIT